MADNLTTPIGSGVIFASDEISGVTYPRTKISWGVDGVAIDVSATNPFPVTFANTTIAVTGSFWPTTQPVSGTVSISNFPATQQVSGTFWQATQPISATALPLPAGAATAAKQPALGTAGSASADVLTVQGITNGVPQTMIPQMLSGGNIAVSTTATGATFVAFASQACKQLTLVNNTGTTVEFRQGAAGIAVPIFDKAAFTIFGITNANQIDVRRTDTGATPITVQARWEA